MAARLNFPLFGRPAFLSVGAFAAPVILYGLLLGPLVERFLPYRPLPGRPDITYWVGFAVLIALFVLGLVRASGSIEYILRTLA